MQSKKLINLTACLEIKLIVKGCSTTEDVSKVLIIAGLQIRDCCLVLYSELTETFINASDILCGQKVSLNSLHSSILS